MILAIRLCHGRLDRRIYDQVDFLCARHSDLLPDDSARGFFLLTRETLVGLALGRATNRGQPLAHEATVLDQLARLANEHDTRLSIARANEHDTRLARA